MVKFNLRVVMATRDISVQAELHRMTGIRKNTISDMVNNVAVSVALQDLDAICEALDCEISDILVREPDPPQGTGEAEANNTATKSKTTIPLTKRKPKSKKQQ